MSRYRAESMLTRMVRKCRNLLGRQPRVRETTARWPDENSLVVNLVDREIWIPVPGDMPGELFAVVSFSIKEETYEIYNSRVFANDVVRVTTLLPQDVTEVDAEFSAINTGERTLTRKKVTVAL